MKASIEITEGKYHDSFEEETEGLESIGKLISETIQKDYPFSFKDSLPNLEMAEINILKMRFPNLEIKDKILLKVINEIEQDLPEEEKKIISYEPNLEKNEINDIDKNISLNIYNSINKFIHKILHCKKNKNIEEKLCIFLEENGKNSDISEDFKNTENDKKICSLKEKNKLLEFIVIKSLMISITNYMTELIDSYLAYYQKLKENQEQKKIGEKETGIESNSQNDENEDDLLKLNNYDEIFSEIYNDFVAKSNKCSELEEYFKYSLESFKNKYQMHFTLSELFTDIFWNSIFHNKALCGIFIDSYSSEDYGDIKLDLRKIMKVIFDTNIPLKRQIVELLGLHQIEINEKKDLMTLIVDMKNKFHFEIIKSEKEKEKENIKQNRKMKELNGKENEKEKEKPKEKEKEENNDINLNNKNIEVENNININTNKKENINENKINISSYKSDIKFDENIKCNIIKAHDIRAFKQNKLKAANSFLAVDSKNNNVIIGVENKTEKKNEINEKENNNDTTDDGIPDFSHKTVDEIINYINDDRIVDKSTKGKRKKKSRKNKRAKKEEAEQNKDQIEDSLVLKFKEELTAEFIHASTITKIKPVISDNWIKLIST